MTPALTFMGLTPANIASTSLIAVASIVLPQQLNIQNRNELIINSD